MQRRDFFRIGAGVLASLANPTRLSELAGALPPAPMGEAGLAAGRMAFINVSIARGAEAALFPLKKGLEFVSMHANPDSYEALVHLGHGIAKILTGNSSEALLRRYLGPAMHDNLMRDIFSQDHSVLLENLGRITREGGQYVLKPGLRISDTPGRSVGARAIQKLRSQMWVANESAGGIGEALMNAPAPLLDCAEVKGAAQTFKAVDRILKDLHADSSPWKSSLEAGAQMADAWFSLISENRWKELLGRPDVKVMISFLNSASGSSAVKAATRLAARKELQALGLDVQRLELAELSYGLPEKAQCFVRQLVFALEQAENYFMGSKTVGYFPPCLQKSIAQLVPLLTRHARYNAALSAKLGEARKILGPDNSYDL